MSKGTIIALIKALTGGKLNAPATEGTSGQVLVTDGNGGRSWGSVAAGEVVIDSTLEVQGAAADAKAVGDALSAQTAEIAEQEIIDKLLLGEMPGTTTAVTFDADDNPTQIVHSENGTVVRTDAFTWGADSVTEVRTLSSGEYITIVTDLTTLAQTISEVEVAS